MAVSPLALPAGSVACWPSPAPVASPARQWRRGTLRVRLRRPGDRCPGDPFGKGADLTKRFQEAAIPPWLRGRLPVVELDGRLVAVADLWLCLPGGERGEEGVRLLWERGSATGP
jgi:tRNA(Ile)-lysidine synthase